MYGWKETTEGITNQSDAALNTLQTSITLIPATILAIAGILLVSLYLPQHRKLMSQNF
jgi:GPH family glycoside/pentoside/hexuronide:cation symporter